MNDDDDDDGNSNSVTKMSVTLQGIQSQPQLILDLRAVHVAL